MKKCYQWVMIVNAVNQDSYLWQKAFHNNQMGDDAEQLCKYYKMYMLIIQAVIMQKPFR